MPTFCNAQAGSLGADSRHWHRQIGDTHIVAWQRKILVLSVSVTASHVGGTAAAL
jgi:hypothetical protein